MAEPLPDHYDYTIFTMVLSLASAFIDLKQAVVLMNSQDPGVQKSINDADQHISDFIAEMKKWRPTNE